MTNAFTTGSAGGVLGALCSDAQSAAFFSGPQFTAQMLAVEAAWTRALCDVGGVSETARDAALAAIAQGVDPELLGIGSQSDGVPVPALVRALRSGVPEDAKAAIHTGLTSQDVVDTAMVLTLRQVLVVFEKRLATLVTLLDDLAKDFGDRPMMARTRMQAALPTTVAHRVDAWRRGLVGQQARLAVLKDTFNVAQIGGAIGARSAPKGQAEAAARICADLLGLKLGPVWHADRSVMVEMGHWLCLLCGSLGKIGQDIALMAQQGVDEVTLSGAGGSSAMPHKQNPVSAELLVTLARYVAGQQGLLAQAMVHEQERSGAAWALEWMTLPAMCEAAGAALSHGGKLLGSVTRLGAAP